MQWGRRLDSAIPWDSIDFQGPVGAGVSLAAPPVPPPLWRPGAHRPAGLLVFGAIEHEDIRVRT